MARVMDSSNAPQPTKWQPILPMPLDAGSSGFHNQSVARILDLGPNKQRITAHSVDKGVVCEHQVVADDDGTTLLHLSTFGSKDRESDPKSSQSLQFDAKVAADLTRVFRDAFGDAALNIQSRIDVAFPSGVAVDPALLAQAYGRDPELFRELISNDEAARDVVAMAHRRSQVERFRKLLNNESYFQSESDQLAQKGNEPVWQHFFEENPWILGISLTGQLLTSWNDQKLEQVVAGHSISGVGKRTDALLRTSGRIKSMVFAEFKTHKKDLLQKTPYRSGCWAPSDELSGGVAQVQGTVHRAVKEIGERLQGTVTDGSKDPYDYTYLLRPRSYLIIGTLDELHGEKGGVHEDKFQSFELYRRQLVEPEVLTFDELLTRAEWIVASESSSSAKPKSDDSVVSDRRP